MPVTRILSIALLLICVEAFGQKVQAVRSRGADYEALVDQLVLTKHDTYQEDGHSYLRREASARINAAAGTLAEAGKKAWPVLMKHLDDQRPSTATRETTGPHDVGLMCYSILDRQVVSLPRGYPRSKTSPEYYMDGVFRPTMKEWLLARRDMPLEAMRIEVLEHVIKIVRDAPRQNAQERAEALADLEAHRTLLQKDLAKVAR